jgi:altronate dehydratase
VNAVLLISDRDNVATALEALDEGRTIQAGAQTLLVAEPIPRGHKIALCAIALGQEVVKYGSAIGRASVDIAAGTHVHTHNVASTRGRGDLSAPDAMARTAEPPDAADSEPPPATEPR